MKLDLDGVARPARALRPRSHARSCRRPATGIFGPSGAGKTSLLEAIAGLRRPRRGRIVLDGTRVR